MTTRLRDRVLNECGLFDAHHVWMDAEAIDDDTLPLLTESLLATYADAMPLGARLRFLAAIRRHVALPPDLRHPNAMSTASDSESRDDQRPVVSLKQPPQNTAPTVVEPPSRTRRVWNAFVWLLALPFRALYACLRVLALGAWRFAALWVTLALYTAVGVFGGVSLYKDLAAYRFSFGNVAVFGSWYVLIGLFVFSLLFSLVWVHSIWVHFVLGERDFIFGDPNAKKADEPVHTAKRAKPTKHE